MRRQRTAIAGAAVSALVVAAFGGSLAFAQKPRTSRPAASARVRPPREPADNSYCLACHVNFKREDLAAKHRVAGIGCARCHGESDKHSADENNITPPDVMYAAEKVNASCARCHMAGALIAASKRNPRAMHGAVLQGKGRPYKPEPTCTSCHGSHRVAARTRRWDKTTGKLIEDDGVRMLKEPTSPK
jgi:hypothetical protein